MTSGYIFTKQGTLALSLADLETVRYAAELDDGTGIVAFDGDLQVLWEHSAEVRLAAEPHPDYPPSWPWEAPKRRVSNGHERFARMTQARFQNISSDPLTIPHITGAVILDDDSVLVETDGFVLIANWTAAAEEVRDKRLVDA